MEVKLKKGVKPFMIRNGKQIFKIKDGSEIPEKVFKLHKNKLKEVKNGTKK